jgi:hypothetical protein
MRRNEATIIAGEMEGVVVMSVFAAAALAPVLIVVAVQAVELAIAIPIAAILALQGIYRLVVPARPPVSRWAAQDAYAALEARKRAVRRERERKAVAGSKRVLDSKSAFNQPAAAGPHPYGISAFSEASK